MCGIVGAVSTRNIVPVLVQGLERLEYRGYDSCGVAVYAMGTDLAHSGLRRARSTSRVAELAEQVAPDSVSGGLQGCLGIAHTRWATHGAPSVSNAHPHFSHGRGSDAHQRPGRIALVHNGIIENHDELRAELQTKGYVFVSQTDTEVIAHLVDSLYADDLLEAVQAAVDQLHGAFAIAVFCKDEPQRLVGARAGSPLILGVGKDGQEHFLASDAMALAGVTDQIVYLEEGDMVDVQLGKYWLLDKARKSVSPAQRPVKTVLAHSGAAELGPYRHYMQKEIFEQPRAIADTLEGLEGIVPELFDLQMNHAPGANAARVFAEIDSVLILACGTSYYSGCTAKYWLESIAKIPTQVEVASEYRYRDSVPNPKTLVVTITQSGETADTLAALRHAQSLGMRHTLTICNVATSAMVRECSLAYVTRAGVEIGVASTKAFTTQLAGLFLMTLALAQAKGRLPEDAEQRHLKAMRHLPAALQAVLALEPLIISWAEDFARKENALFLGRGLHYPIAMEGALKLKEITYIHAEAYPAGELKHGPLALVTSEMPVVIVAPNDTLLEKLKSNMHEVRARGGVLYVLADADSRIESGDGIHVIRMPEHYGELSPLLHVVPLQLLAYHTACARGTDVDKPRNLAKSVTVE
ncbi:glutamine--fructose-6-phosphate transaminase (isomerizing) [Candidatus Aalborgicola defluviihabitans]|uniref:glutamine--fructose-6-phosphate transaminase (isomerizing) n=1 Tax=Candidatus Aalborgicola defluviihabitans TaxID=3386187 RepID=UPI001DB08DAB|nr:glutamine--fructose-6-phosphate transaminase (isomerizing) [Burkholderiales bacterium]MBK6569430.1 glutamine--fructose-6-phosphate transaminase (isomerizing) [Burkholderiales bacterium]MBK7280849.1 glutamine--fructose-6-phosphate transaminase (isomerizing) [Burkholderiales bacterium]MBK7315877.1 glutamine--fructose-6-phosphate transaminase (isomerizing) [Burkholderiales bacterium]MBL0243876.1 glutamine--fructose-6-phosphate transaminase (isomerizing) [Rhodoferax sp.]